MKKRTKGMFFQIICMLIAGFCFSANGASHPDRIELVGAWEISGLKQPESVLYDSKRDMLYVSNVNGSPLEKNGQGFISQITPDGKMIELKWITGANAPKGMVISGDKLYASDIDNLLEIDIEKGCIVNTYSAQGAKFLNDLAADGDGNIYVSDMLENTIYRLSDGVFQVWIKDSALEFPNGLYEERSSLYVASWGVMTDGFKTDVPGHIKIVSLKNKKVVSLGSSNPIGNLDGLEPDGKGNFFVTDFMVGKLFHVKMTGETILLQDLNPGSADLEYIPEKEMIIIPMMNDNLIQAFKIK